jgi:hypothetical protein
MQHPRSSSPHRLASASAVGLHDKAAALGVRHTSPAPAAVSACTPTSRAQTSPDRACMQPAASWMPKLPLAAAGAAPSVCAGARHTSPGPCNRNFGSSSTTPRQKCFKVPYQFSTPTEKRLQKQLEVSLAPNVLQHSSAGLQVVHCPHCTLHCSFLQAGFHHQVTNLHE